MMKPALPLPRVPNALHSLRVMVLEDDPFCAILLEDMLHDLGFTVLGPFGELDDAVAFVETHGDEIDVAILDVNIHGEYSYNLAELLVRRKMPFFFSTGYTPARLPLRWRMWPNIGKLFTEARLVAMIGQCYASPADQQADHIWAADSVAAK